MKEKSSNCHLDTLLSHAARAPREHYGAVNIPVYRASTILFNNYADFLKGDHSGKGDWRKGGLTYGRRGTPLTQELSKAVALLEGGEETFLTGSGVAAIAVTMLGFLAPGDHFLMSDNVYAPTRMWGDGVGARIGVTYDSFSPRASAEEISRMIKSETKVIFCEAPGSLTFEINDLPAIVALAKERDIKVIVDNTWGAGYYYRPLALGADVSIQAGTKYISGHSDFLLGAITAKDERTANILRKTHYLFGQCVDGDTAFLAIRGLRTLAVRMEKHFESALKAARYFEKRSEIVRVLYPALESSPDHALWKRDFTGACGLFGVVFKPEYSEAQIAAFIDALQLFGIGFSWGGFESLVMPCPYDLGRDCESEVVRPGETLVRFHIGLEKIDDLLADFDAAFSAMRDAG